MWNSRNLSPPPYCELRVVLKTGHRDTITGVRNILKRAEKVVQDHVGLLKTEDFVLKRIIYKLSNQFRSDKALQCLRQINACMKHLEEVDVQKQIRDLLVLVDRQVDLEDTEMYLPSRQVIEYHLVRLQGTATLLRQTVCYSEKTFIHAREHIELGNMISQNLLMLALTSRIWFVCLSLCHFLCEWYHRIYPSLTLFTPTAVQWLSKNDSLPLNLTEWLTQMFGDIDSPEKQSEIMESVEKEKDAGNLPVHLDLSVVSKTEDLGEPILRDSVINRQPLTSTVAVNKFHNDSRLHDNTVDINETTEDGLRSVDDELDEKVSNNSATKNENLEVDEKLIFTKKRKVDWLSADKKDRKRNKKTKLSETENADTVTENQSRVDDVIKDSVEHDSTKTANKESNDAKQMLVEIDSEPAVEMQRRSFECVKSCLETSLRTFKDFENLLSQIQSRSFGLGDMHFELTKKGTRKILQNVEKWKMSSATSSSLKSFNEQKFLKKLRGPLSKMLVDSNTCRKGEVGGKRDMVQITDTEKDIEKSTSEHCNTSVSVKSHGTNSGIKPLETVFASGKQNSGRKKKKRRKKNKQK